MKRVERFLILIVAILVILAFVQGGWSLFWDGLSRGAAILRSAALLVLLAFAASGLAEVLLQPDTIKKWMGGTSSTRGAIIGSAAGALTPGGPYVYYPIAMMLKRTGASTCTLISYITGKSLWDISRIPLELGFMGVQFLLVRLAVTWFVPPLVGYISGAVFKEPAGSAREGERA